MTNSQFKTSFEARTYKDHTPEWLWVMSKATDLPVAKMPTADGKQSLTDDEKFDELQKLFEFAFECGVEAGYKKKSAELRALLEL